MAPRRPPEGDVARAYFCSKAILLGSSKEIEEFFAKTEMENSFIRFGMVHVSLDRKYDPRPVKFLVAYAEDATFIAFRGARNAEDIDLDYHSSTSSGKLHEGVLELSKRFMGSDFKLLDALLYSGKRIIFCGQRNGGAVAHMVVLRFWTEYNATEELYIKPEDHPNTMISIAFEAPNFCDSTCAGNVNGDRHLKSHFFNYFVDDDFLEPNGQQDQEYGFSIGKRIHLTVPRGHINMGSCMPVRTKPKGSFKSAVLAAGLPLVSADRPPNFVLEVTSPVPNVTSAIRSASDSGIFITIKGYDLLFLREPVKLDGLHPWETRMQTDNELLIFDPNEAYADDKRDNALSIVVLETAFGGTKHPVLEDTMSGGAPTAVPSLLKRIVQTFFILATPPLCYLPPNDVLKDLDSIIQCEPDSKCKKLSTVLKSITKDGSKKAHLKEDLWDPDKRKTDFIEQKREAGLINERMKEVNDDVDKVIQFLTRSYNIEYEVKKIPLILGCVAGGLLLGAGLVLLPLGGLALAAGGVATIAMAVTVSGAAATAAGGGAASVAAVRLGKGEFMVRDYEDMLKIAIHEAALWHGRNEKSKKLSSTDLDNGDLSKLDIAALESLLQKEVECSGRSSASDGCTGSCLADMIEKIEKSETTDITLCSRTLKTASLSSKKNMVRRMQIVAKTIVMCAKKEVKGIDFVGLVGAEDAGKSTFIMKAIQKFGENCDPEDLPEVGFKVHTMTVRPYKLNNSLYLVDFPGSNGTEKYAHAWRQFTSLPSSCILLLTFMDDIKQDQIDMYKTMKKDLDSKNVIVVFNKVDEKFTSRREAGMDAEYFTEQRTKCIAKLEGCKSEDVHFVCLDPDITEERFTKLRNVGVLNFEELAEKVLHLS